MLYHSSQLYYCIVMFLNISLYRPVMLTSHPPGHCRLQNDKWVKCLKLLNLNCCLNLGHYPVNIMAIVIYKYKYSCSKGCSDSLS